MSLLMRTKRPSKPCAWDHCPPEIIYKIFDYLDAASLLNCMVVNRRWYCIVLNIARMAGWTNLAVHGLPDRGATFTKKSTLTWKDVLINCSYWQNVKVARAHYANQYDIENILKVNIYKGNIIVVTPSKVIYFDQETYNLKKTIKYPCSNFDENDHMYVASTLELHELTVCHKPYPFSEWQLQHSAKFHAQFYKLIYNHCYIVSIDNSITYLTWLDETWRKIFMARFYGHGKISDFTLYRDKVYAIMDWGQVIKVDKQGLKFVLGFTYNIPRSDVTMFKTCGAVISGLSYKKIKFKQQGSRHWLLTCPNLTCAIVHNEILLLGYKNGKVQIFIPNKITKSKPKPEFTFNVQKFAKFTLTDPAIVAMDVSELIGFHELYIATKSHLLQIMLVYPYSLNKFMAKTSNNN